MRLATGRGGGSGSGGGSGLVSSPRLKENGVCECVCASRQRNDCLSCVWWITFCIPRLVFRLGVTRTWLPVREFRYQEIVELDHLFC